MWPLVILSKYNQWPTTMVVPLVLSSRSAPPTAPANHCHDAVWAVAGPPSATAARLRGPPRPPGDSWPVENHG